jgi:hypothetical protein
MQVFTLQTVLAWGTAAGQEASRISAPLLSLFTL